MKKYVPFVIIMIILEMILYLPLLSSFFDPQEFISLLNPLNSGMSFSDYMIESWSWIQGQQRIGFFRPVVSLMFMAEFPLWGANPAGYRAMNLVLHLCVALSVIPLARRIGIRKYWWLPSTLVLIHPGALDAVWLIVARHDVLAVFFSIAALIGTFDLIRGKLKGLQGVLPWVATLFAIGSKELGMANLLALPLLVILWPKESPDRKALLYFWFSIPLVLLLFLGSRLMVFGNIGGYGQYTPLSEIPVRIYFMLIQSTGFFFMQNVFMRIILASVVVLMALALVSTWKRQWQKILTLSGLFLIYGFQSIISQSCMHYIYVIMVFFSMTAGLAVETGSYMSSGKDLRRILLCGFLMVMLFMASLNWSSTLRYMNSAKQEVFEAVSAQAEVLAAKDSVAVVLYDRSIPRVDELKNIERYLDFLKPGNNVNFRYVEDESDVSAGETRIIWRDDNLVIGSLP